MQKRRQGFAASCAANKVAPIAGDKEDVMENANRLHPQSSHAPHTALEKLRRLSREVFLDLGLTEREIAAYFGGDLERLKTLAPAGDAEATGLATPSH